MEGTVNVRAIGNTIDGGGSLAQTLPSYGVHCLDTSASAVTMSSNLVHAGSSAVHMMLESSGGAGACGNAASWDHTYFSHGPPGGRHVSDDVAVVATSGAVADAQGDIIGDANTCFDTTLAQPDFRIAAGSACVNKGVVGTRVDGSPITMDLTGGARVKGIAADIGAHEKE